ncbi:MAG: ubiquinol-cytochrome c reductase iron-sulfur subunit [Gammaproteobacteria bacterium]|nr:ubiquinol-cytochrome c reductase iron-sulfur subunit [Gammaproteobacteria bacterium]
MNPGHSRRRLLRMLGVWLGMAWSGARAADRVGDDDEDGEPLEVPLADVAPGEMVEVQWRGRPVFVRHRTAEEIARERAVPLDALRDPEPDQARAQRPEWVVVEGICTHAGCIPTGPLGDYDGWYCLCHGSQFDTAGRVRSGPARTNLKIPPYQFVSAVRVRLGAA